MWLLAVFSFGRACLCLRAIVREHALELLQPSKLGLPMRRCWPLEWSMTGLHATATWLQSSVTWEG